MRKFFKTISILPMVLLTVVACEEKTNTPPASVPDEISVTPRKISLKNEIGASRSVMVESSSEWTLSAVDGAQYDFVESSAVTGASGTVKFTVTKLNDTEEEKTAEFVFTAGTATAPLTVVIAAGQKVVDEIVLSSSAASFSNEDDVTTSKTMVLSSGDWTLAPEQDGGYAWIEPDKTSGHSEEEVTFSVKKDLLSESDEATFIFTVGTETAKYVISYTHVNAKLVLKSESEPVLGAVAQVYNLVVNSDIQYDALDVTIEPVDGWLTKKVVTEGDDAGDAKVMLDAAKNETASIREAIVTVTGENAEPLVVTVKQLPLSSIVVTENSYKISDAGEEITIEVESNVEFVVTAEDDWLTVGESDGKTSVKVSAQAYDGQRTSYVCFTEKNPGIGVEALVVKVPVVQMSANAIFAANMKGNRFYVKDGSNTAYTNFTYEMLVRPDSFNKISGQPYTLIGVPGSCVVRTGDDAGPSNIQIDAGELAGKVQKINTNASLSVGVWQHLAVTFEYSGNSFLGTITVKVYINGILNGQGELKNFAKLKPLMGWKGNTNDGGFFLGFGWTNVQDFYGQVAEVRVWTKVLTAEEIKAENHFYDVDPKSEDLFAYWKFNAGAGNSIEDLTGKGHTLYGERDIVLDGNICKGTPGIDWVPADYKK